MMKDTKQVSVKLDDELRTEIERRASASERSMGAEIRVLLRRALGAEQRPQAA